MKKIIRAAILLLVTTNAFAESNFNDFANYPITDNYEGHLIEAKAKLIQQGPNSSIRSLLTEMARANSMEPEDIYDYLVDYFIKLELDKDRLNNFARRAGDYRNDKHALYTDIGQGFQYYISPNPLRDDTLKSVLTPSGWVFLNHLSDAFRAQFCFIEKGTDVLDVTAPFWNTASYTGSMMHGSRGVKDGWVCKYAFFYQEKKDGFSFAYVDKAELRANWNRHLREKGPYKVKIEKPTDKKGNPVDVYKPKEIENNGATKPSTHTEVTIFKPSDSPVNKPNQKKSTGDLAQIDQSKDSGSLVKKEDSSIIVYKPRLQIEDKSISGGAIAPVKAVLANSRNTDKTPKKLDSGNSGSLSAPAKSTLFDSATLNGKKDDISYRLLLDNDGIKKKTNGEWNTWIPNDMGNRHWREYQDWLAKGNTPEPVPVEHIRSKKLSEIRGAAETALNSLTKGYPQSEILTWPTQEAEARSYLNNPNMYTPLLDGLVATRGVSKDELAQQILEKVETSARISGHVIGQRQKLEKRLSEAKTTSEIESIEVDIQVPPQFRQ